MTDIHESRTRSYNMSRIRSKNTKPELLVRRYLFSKGFRYKLYDKSLPGKPDIVLPKYRSIFFIHGCFWHGHDNCKKFVLPKTNSIWWSNKITATKVNDEINHTKLQTLGYNVFEIYECEILSPRFNDRMDEIILKLQSK